MEEAVIETNISQRIPHRPFNTLREDLSNSLYFFVEPQYSLPEPIMDHPESDYLQLTPFTAYNTDWVPLSIQKGVRSLFRALHWTIDIPLHQDEDIYFLSRPYYGKNILIMSFILFLFLTLLFLVPALAISWHTHPDTRGILMNILMYILGIGYIIVIFYFLIYRTFYRRMTIQYILTNHRAIITGYRPVFSNRLEQHSANNALGGTTMPYYYSSHPYEDFTEISFLPENTLEIEEGPGSIFFGYAIENYVLPFSILTYATNLGFESIDNVPDVLNMLLYFTQQVGSTVQQANMLRSHPTKKFISKTVACLGFGGQHHRQRSGVISSQQYHLLTSDDLV